MTRLTCVLGSALIAVSLLSAPAALADPIAGDEYALDLPGARDSVNSTLSPEVGNDGKPSDDRVQAGVVGENLPTRSVLSSASSLLGGPLIVAIALGGFALISFGPRSSRISRTR